MAPPETLPVLTPENPLTAIRIAMKEGVVRPRREWFRGAAYMPPYHPNYTYAIYLPEGNSTNIEFGPGERIKPATCSDGETILSHSYTSRGMGPSKAWVWQIKARMTAPPQDCTITTNRGTYVLQVVTTTDAHTRIVRWSDPYAFMAEIDPEGPELICQQADINYTLTGPPGAFGLRPGDISNDGMHTCIRFPQSAAFDLPAVWLVEGGNERPASPSMIDGAYLIDGVPPVIVLRTDAVMLRVERVR